MGLIWIDGIRLDMIRLFGFNRKQPRYHSTTNKPSKQQSLAISISPDLAQVHSRGHGSIPWWRTQQSHGRTQWPINNGGFPSTSMGNSTINGGFNGKFHYKWRFQWKNHLKNGPNRGIPINNWRFSWKNPPKIMGNIPINNEINNDFPVIFHDLDGP